MLVFREIWRALFSCKTRFEIRPFTLLLAIWKYYSHVETSLQYEKLRKYFPYGTRHREIITTYWKDF